MRNWLKIKKNILPIICVLLLCSFSLVLSGCGASSDSISDIIDTGGDTDGGSVDYSGIATILGKINLSSLVQTDLTEISNSYESSLLRSKIRGRSVRAREIDPNTEAVRLYVIGADGELEYTGIDCECEDYDPNTNKIEYTCPNVQDGINFIVKYVKLLGDNRAVELKAEVSVPEGQTEVEAEVSAQTTAVVECLRNAILDATVGLDISQEIVESIIDAVKIAVVTLVQSGVIQIPSMIVETEGNTLSEVLEEETENETLADKTGTIISDDSVSSNLDVVITEVQSSQFTDSGILTNEEKAALIARVFVQLTGEKDGGGIPNFMIEFFTDKYIEGATLTLAEMFSAITAGLELRVALPSGVSPSKSGAIAEFSAVLGEMYTLMEKKQLDSTSLTDAEREALADIPPVLMGLFPLAQKTSWLAVGDTTIFNIPQGIAFTLFVIDEYIAGMYEEVEDAFGAATTSDDGSIQYDREDPYEFNPMRPGSLMEILGFFEVADQYNAIDIFDLWLHPGVCWIQGADGMGQEVDMLHAGACFGDLMAMLAQYEGGEAPTYQNVSVTLTYPTRSGGTGTVALVSEAELYNWDYNDPFSNCYILDPWMEANQDQAIQEYQEEVGLDEPILYLDPNCGDYEANVAKVRDPNCFANRSCFESIGKDCFLQVDPNCDPATAITPDPNTCLLELCDEWGCVQVVDPSCVVAASCLMEPPPEPIVYIYPDCQTTTMDPYNLTIECLEDPACYFDMACVEFINPECVVDPNNIDIASLDPNCFLGGTQEGTQDTNMWVEPDPNRIISDFGSGTYTVTVTIDGEPTTRAFTRKVITGMSNMYPKLVSPKPWPEWPGDHASEEEMQAFNEAMDSYQMTNYTANAYLNADQTADGYDAATVTISWKAPLIDSNSLPEGVLMGYELDVGAGGCDIDGYCYWDQIYSTWEEDRILFGTSLKLPTPVPKQDLTAQPYSVNIHIVFIDSATGCHIGQGGNAHAEFRVADPIDPTATFTITAPVTLSMDDWYSGPDVTLSAETVTKLKVAVMRETYNSDALLDMYQWTREVLVIADVTSGVDGALSYTITPTIGDFLSTSDGGWTNLVVFHDLNGNDDIDDQINSEPGHEPWWDQDWESQTRVHIDGWGGMVRVHTETCIDGFCQYDEQIITGAEEEPVTGPTLKTRFWYDPVLAEAQADQTL
ncbi:MAG: hypothetical protein ACMUJM_06685 [bacterium]